MRVFFLCLVVFAETALLGLAHWQYRRYLGAQEENARPHNVTTLYGHFLPAATTVLDNQPHPQQPSRIGWRLLVPFKTESQTILVDRGWIPLPADRGTFPAELAGVTPASPMSITVALKPYPVSKGWLKGPATTTDPRILTRMAAAPAPVSVTAEAFAYQIDPAVQLPPGRNPQRHFSYMLQWLGLALALPVLVVIRLRRRP